MVDDCNVSTWEMGDRGIRWPIRPSSAMLRIEGHFGSHKKSTKRKKENARTNASCCTFFLTVTKQDQVSSSLVDSKNFDGF